MATVIDICKGGIVCRDLKKMWECREEHGTKLQKILTCWSHLHLEPKTFRFFSWVTNFYKL